MQNVIPEAQRRGIGSALTIEELKDAMALGYNIGVLRSSEMGYQVYSRLGFKDYCIIERYVWVSGPGE
jgi:predicted N-acetyltransferase YhbS